MYALYLHTHKDSSSVFGSLQTAIFLNVFIIFLTACLALTTPHDHPGIPAGPLAGTQQRSCNIHRYIYITLHFPSSVLWRAGKAISTVRLGVSLERTAWTTAFAVHPNLSPCRRASSRSVPLGRLDPGDRCVYTMMLFMYPTLFKVAKYGHKWKEGHWRGWLMKKLR